MTTNRPPSCDLPPQQNPCSMCGFRDTEVIDGTIELQGYCPACQMQGPDRATEVYAIQSWNSIPRRYEVLELLDKIEHVACEPDNINKYEEFLILLTMADKLRKEMGA